MKFQIIGLASLIIAAALPASEYFVSTTGSDRNPGNGQSPFRTVGRAISAAGSPGDVITISEGTYYPERTLNFGNPGAAGKPITLRSAEGDSVVIDGTKTAPKSNLIAIGTSYIRIEGITVCHAQGNGIVAWGPGSRVHHIEVVGNTIHHCYQSGFYAGNNNLKDPVRDILAENNEIYEVSLMNVQRSMRGGWSFGLGAGLSKNVVLRNNTVYRSHGEGIGLYLSDKGQIDGNTVYDNYAVNIYLDNTTSTQVLRNLVYSTGDKRFFRNGRPTNGIQIANEDYQGFSNPSKENRITDNVLIQNGAGFCYGGYQKGGGLVDTIFSNNTVFGSTGAMISIDADNGHQATRIENNIFYQTSRFPFTYQPGANARITFENNLWFGAPVPEPARSASDQKADPQFANPGGFSRRDYRPAKDSVASKGDFGARVE